MVALRYLLCQLGILANCALANPIDQMIGRSTASAPSVWADAPQFTRSLPFYVVLVGIAWVTPAGFCQFDRAKRNAASLAGAGRIPHVTRAGLLVYSPVTSAVSTAPLRDDFRLLANAAMGGLGSLAIAIPDFLAFFQWFFFLVSVQIGFAGSTAPMASDNLGAVGVTAFGFLLSLLATWFQFLPRSLYAVVAQENITSRAAITAIDFFRRAIGALAWFDSTHGKLLKKSAG